MNIGLTQRVLVHNKQYYDCTDQDWYDFFEEHQITTIKNITTQDFSALADTLDCLVITGGDDHPIRHMTELRLATEMLKRQKPIIGICHGCFLLQDLLGGTMKDIDGHHNEVHNVIYKDREYQVNSFHTLSIEKPHDEATVLATDMNGNCEAWIDGKIAGIVWHPERMEESFVPDEILSLMEG